MHSSIKKSTKSKAKATFLAPVRNKITDENVKTAKKLPKAGSGKDNKKSSHNKIKGPGKTKIPKEDTPKGNPKSLTDQEYERIFQDVLAAAVKDAEQESYAESNLNEKEHDIETCGDNHVDNDETDIELESCEVDEWDNRSHKKSVVFNTGEIKNPTDLKKKHGSVKKKTVDITPEKNKEKKAQSSKDKAHRIENTPKHIIRNNNSGSDQVDTDEETGTWIQCSSSNCGKWRYVEDISDPIDVPENWECKMNSDKEHNRCDAPEIDYDETEHIMTSFTLGSVVWAKMDGFPWWPAMVDSDPDYDTYFELPSSTSMIPYLYHVTFFDDHVSRAWVKSHMISPYQEDSRPKSNPATKSHYGKAELRTAIKNAEAASHLNIEKRLERFCFLKRYSKAKKAAGERTKKTNEKTKNSSLKNKYNNTTEKILSSSKAMLKELEEAIETCNTSDDEHFSGVDDDEDLEFLPEKKRRKFDSDDCKTSPNCIKQIDPECNATTDPSHHSPVNAEPSLSQTLYGGDNQMDANNCDQKIDYDPEIFTMEIDSKDKNDLTLRCDKMNDNSVKNIGFDTNTMSNTAASSKSFERKERTKKLSSKKIANSEKLKRKSELQDSSPVLMNEFESELEKENLYPECNKSRNKTPSSHKEEKKEKTHKNVNDEPEDKLHAEVGNSTEKKMTKQKKVNKTSKLNKLKLTQKGTSCSQKDGENQLDNVTKSNINENQNREEPMTNKKLNENSNTSTQAKRNKISAVKLSLKKDQCKSKTDICDENNLTPGDTIFSEVNDCKKKSKSEIPTDSTLSTTKKKLKLKNFVIPAKVLLKPSIEDQKLNLYEDQTSANNTLKDVEAKTGRQKNITQNTVSNSVSRGKEDSKRKLNEVNEEGKRKSKENKISLGKEPSNKQSKCSRDNKMKSILKEKSKINDRKVPSVRNKGKNFSCIKDMEHDQSVPDVTSSIIEENEDELSDLDLDYPKTKDVNQNHDNNFSEEEELNLSIDSLENEDKKKNILSGANKVKKGIQKDRDDSYGRFGGHCSDHGSMSDPFELIEE